MTTLRVREQNKMSLRHSFPPMADNDVVSHAFDFSRILGAATISSATWDAVTIDGASSSCVSIGTPSNASGISTATVTASNPGTSLITCQITDSGGQKRTARAYLRVLKDEERY